MKTFIEARSTGESSIMLQAEVGIVRKDLPTLTEASALVAVQLLAPIDAKTGKAVPVKYYKHICLHEEGKSCTLEEIKIEADPIEELEKEE
jgi:hypothetical protein